MPTILRKVLYLALLIPSAVVPSYALAGYREYMHVTAVEIVQLPQFCWAQFEVPGAQGDEFTIHDCGPLMNHYCPGLIYLIRGKGSAAKGKPLPLIQHADSDVAYTEKGMADYPRCPIREHVEATRAEINQLLRVYGSPAVAPKR